MKAIVRWIPVVALSLGVATARADRPRHPLLAEDAPFLGRLERGQASWIGAVVVPEGVSTFRVVVSSRQDVDLQVRRGLPASDEPGGQADAKSEGPTGDEAVEVDAAPDTWFLTVSHPAAERGGATFAVVAVFEGGPRPPLLLEERVRGVDPAGTAFRAWFPLAAESIRFETTGSLVIHGPSGFKAEREPGGAPLVLRRQDGIPWGMFLGQVTSAPEGSTLRMQVGRPVAGADGAVPILAGVEEEFTIGGDAPPERSYRLEVPTGVAGFVATIVADEGSDLDLYARRGTPIALNDEEADYFALSSGREERLIAGGEGPLAAGTYYLDVTTVDVERAAQGTLTVVFTPEGPNKTPVWGSRDPTPLYPGSWNPGRIVAATSAFSWHAVDVPPTTRRLVAQVVDASSPVDLVLARRDSGAIVRRSLTERVDETLEVTFGDDVPAGGRYVLGVVNRTVGEEEVRFRVAFAFDRTPPLPSDLRAPPFHDLARLNSTERVASAVCEVMVRGTGGGSATCVTPGGLLLSCRHVFQVGDAREPLQREGILVGFSDDFHRPPRQYYVARMVDSDEGLDLALLELTGDVYGRTLPPSLRLPYLPLGDSTRLALGDHVTAFGFPEAGSEHCRTAIIVSRGIVAGLEADTQGQVWVKTDAWIANGHSGGALVDSDHRLVGIPTATLGDRRTLGLVRPVSRLPDRWKAMIRKGLEPPSK